MKITQDYTSYYGNYMSNTVSYFDSFIKIYIAICIILFIFLIYTYIMMYKLFEKLGIKGWKALIPFYNSWLFLEKVGLPPILGVIPGINGIAMLIAYYKYGQSIGKSKLFSILLAIIPPVMLTIILFSKDKKLSTSNDNKTYSTQSQTITNNQQDIASQTSIQQLMSIDSTQDQDINNQQSLIQNNENINNQQEIISNPIYQQYNSFDNRQNINPEAQQSISNNINSNPISQNGETEFIRCKRCGTNVKKGNNICFICGTKLE